MDDHPTSPLPPLPPPARPPSPRSPQRDASARPASSGLVGPAGGPPPEEVVHAMADPDRRIGPPVAAPGGGPAGRYVLLGELGRGGMGVVYRAHDLALGRPVAIKTLLQSLLGSDRQLRRFRREAIAIGRLRHPGIVGVHEVGVHHGRPYIVMDHVDGHSLESLLHVARLPPRQVAHLLARVARALQHAHEHGIVHRDVKPENILVDSQGEPHLVDFGLARDDLADENLTATGQMLGTPLFMAPEQMATRLGRVGPPTDVWGAGAVLYYALARRLPFEAEAVCDVVTKVLSEQPPSPAEVDRSVPEDISAIAMRCLQKHPDDRYPTARALAEDLERFVAGRGTRARGWEQSRSAAAARPARRLPRGPLAAVAALAVVGVVALPFVVDRGPPEDLATVVAPERRLAPWPAPGAPWTRVLAWGEGERAAFELRPGPLWADGEGRVADPLAGARDGSAAALAAAFLGEARRVGAREVAVRYDPRRAITAVQLERQKHWFDNGEQGAGRIEDGPLHEGRASARYVAPNDTAGHVLHVGDARWIAPRVGVTLGVAPIDISSFTFLTGAGHEGLALFGRSRLASVAGGVSVPFDLVPGRWHRIVFDPAGPRGERVVLDGLPSEVLDAVVVAPSGPEPVMLSAVEIEIHLAEIDVEGEPHRPDVPAGAWAEAELGARARVAVAYEIERPAAGGPFVALGDPEREVIRGELDGDRLTLRRGTQWLGAADVPGGAPREGWLALRREDDILRLELGSGATAEPVIALEAIDPLPLAAAGVRAGWGSTAPRVRFGAIEVHRAPGDESREALDRAHASGALDAALARLRREAEASPRAAWRLGALLLARASAVAWADPVLLRPRGEPRKDAAAMTARLRARQARAREAVAALEDAIGRLDSVEARGDALARAVLGSIVAGDAERAVAFADRLVALGGEERARALIDRLEWRFGRPVLFDDIVAAYNAAAFDPMAAVAAADVGIRLADGPVGETLYQKALALRALSRGEADLRAVIELLERARAEGVEPARVDQDIAVALDLLGEPEESARLWRRAAHALRQRHDWWAWGRLGAAEANAGRPAAAVEAWLGVVARRSTGVESMAEMIVGLIQQKRIDQTSPGVAAIALQALSDALEEQQPGTAAALRADGHRIALAVGAGAPARERDLALYVRVRAGERPALAAPAEGDGERPTLALIRARLRPEPAGQARAMLVAAEDRDLLVGSVARIDPVLRPAMLR